MHGFFHQFPKTWKKARKPIEWEKPGKLVPGKILQKPSYVENLGNWYSYFSHGMSAFFPLDSHPVVYFIICEIHGCPHQFPIAWENTGNPSNWESLGNWYLFFPKVWLLFFHQIPPILWYTLPHGKCMAFPMNFQ